MIIYFTGTGNSHYIADAIADRLKDEIISANDFIKKKRKGSFASEKPYVFVFPVYLSTSPTILRKWILASSFSGSKDAYFVPTCAGTAGSVPNSSRDLCKETGYFNYRGSCRVIMPQNYVAHFKLMDPEKAKLRIGEAEQTVDAICELIRKGDDLTDKMVSSLEYAATKAVEKWYNGRATGTKKFMAADACIGCGLCEKNCPTNAIAMKEGKPVWVKKLCIHCMACINRCPKSAIEYGKGTAKKGRYVCPNYKKQK